MLHQNASTVIAQLGKIINLILNAFVTGITMCQLIFELARKTPIANDILHCAQMGNALRLMTSIVVNVTRTFNLVVMDWTVFLFKLIHVYQVSLLVVPQAVEHAIEPMTTGNANALITAS